MTWNLAEGDRIRFDAVGGERPFGVQQVDKTGRFGVLDLLGDDAGRHAAIWDLRTGRLVWTPERAHAMCWNPEATEVLVAGVEQVYERGYLRRYTWPDLVPRGGGTIPMGGYSFVFVTISPRGTLVGIADIDQGETYVALYRTPIAEAPLKPVGVWEHRDSNLINGLAFSPDETALTWTLGMNAFWWTRQDEPGPSEGGEFQMGNVCIWRILDGRPGEVRMVKVLANVPKGWAPSDPEDLLSSEMFQGPVFLDDQHFRILPPTGEWTTYALDGTALPNPHPREVVNLREATTYRLP